MLGVGDGAGKRDILAHKATLPYRSGALYFIDDGQRDGCDPNAQLAWLRYRTAWLRLDTSSK